MVAVRGDRLAVREVARLKGFPETYLFWGTDKYRQVCNASPPLIGRKIAEMLLQEVSVAGVQDQPAQILGKRKHVTVEEVEEDYEEYAGWAKP